jgi:hypothetical protein
VLPFFKLL